MLPTWLQIIIAIFGLIGTVLGILGITAYISERMKHKAQRRNQQEDKELSDIENFKHQHYLNELRSIIKEENQISVAPIIADVSRIQSQIKILADGSTDMLRERILSTYYKCMEKGYRTQYDYENVDHMHKDYIGLGGNSFVETCVAKIKALPSEEEFKAKKKTTRKPRQTKKQILLEDK